MTFHHEEYMKNNIHKPEYYDIPWTLPITVNTCTEIYCDGNFITDCEMTDIIPLTEPVRVTWGSSGINRNNNEYNYNNIEHDYNNIMWVRPQEW